MEIRKIILTRGIPGSGKSTWARAWVEESPETRIRINYDDLRNMMGPYWVPSREPMLDHIIWPAINAAAYNDLSYDMVIDNMNLNPKVWKKFEDWVETFNKSSFVTEHDVQYVLEFKDFFIPVEECIKRDAMRPKPIGEKTIKDIWRKYRHFIQTTQVEKLVNNLVEYDPNKEDCIVIDMDSTMCFNTSKRPWYGPGSTEGMITDIPNKGVVDVVKAMQDADYNIIVCTGRNEAQREVTEQWLKGHYIEPTEIYMRNDYDYRKGVEIKEELIKQILQKYNITAIFEDCEPIVQKLRDMGLTVLQPNKGI